MVSSEKKGIAKYITFYLNGSFFKHHHIYIKYTWKENTTSVFSLLLLLLLDMLMWIDSLLHK